MSYKKNDHVNEMEKQLKQLKLAYELVSHPAIKTVKEGLDFLGIPPEQGVSTLLVKQDGAYRTVIRRDDHKVDFKKIKKNLKVKNLQVATAEEVLEVLRCEIGYVSLYNPQFVPLIDASIMEVGQVYGGTGSPFFDLKISPADLVTLVGGELADIAGEQIDYPEELSFQHDVRMVMEPAIRERFPEFDFVILPVYGVTIDRPTGVMTRELYDAHLDSGGRDKLYDRPELANFRALFSALGIDPQVTPPAVEALLRHHDETGIVPEVNNIVDIQNAESIRSLIAMGIFDLDTIKGDICLRYTEAGEEFKPLGGGVERLPAGVAVISDEEKVLSRIYTDSEYQRVTKRTKNIVIVGDKVPGIPYEDVEKAVLRVGREIAAHAGGQLGTLARTVVAAPTYTPARVKKHYSILTGITPSGSGEIHIGNYFGAVVPFLELAQQADRLYFFMADLHALTTVQDRKQLQKNVETQILSYLACGFDLNKVMFYRQSDIPQHTELQSIFNNITPLGLIKRCHAYKDKLQKGMDEDEVNMGLFNYPVLMAADILLYDPDYVPVGEDQRQHIEVARDIADAFNKKFGKTFKLPDIYNIKETAKLIGTDGERKMSKSLGNYISIFEDEAVIKKQIMGCFTDPKRIRATDPGTVEGNPVFIYHDLINQDRAQVAELKDRYRAGKVGDVEVKNLLFEAHLKRFATERARYAQLQESPEMVKKILEEGADKVRTQAVDKLLLVRDRIGLTNRYSFYRYKSLETRI